MSQAIATVSNSPYLTMFKKNITEQVQKEGMILSAIKPITSAAEKNEAEVRLQVAKKTRKAVEDIRKNETVKLDNQKKEAMAAEREFAGQLDAEISRVEGAINTWNNAELKRVRAEQAAVREEQERKARRLRSETSIANNEIVGQAKVQAIQATAPTSISTQWVMKRVVNQDLVPSEYLSVDEAKVKAAIKQGIRVIPGLEIAEEAKRTGR